MSPVTDAYRSLRPLAGLQAGVVTREQAAGHGLGPGTVERFVRQGHWRRLAPGVFLTSDGDPGLVAWSSRPDQGFG